MPGIDPESELVIHNRTIRKQGQDVAAGRLDA